MIDFIGGLWNGVVGFFASLIGAIGSLVTFNPVAPFLSLLSDAWQTVGAAYAALTAYVPLGRIADAARGLLPLFVVIIVVFIVRRFFKLVS